MKTRMKDGLLHCARCDKYKLPQEFHKDKTKKDGRATYCRSCRGDYQRDYQKHYYLTHRDTLLPKHRLWGKTRRLNENQRKDYPSESKEHSNS